MMPADMLEISKGNDELWRWYLWRDDTLIAQTTQSYDAKEIAIDAAAWFLQEVLENRPFSRGDQTTRYYYGRKTGGAYWMMHHKFPMAISAPRFTSTAEARDHRNLTTAVARGAETVIIE